MEILKPYRKRIDDLDDKIVDLLCEREGIIREVAELKGREGIPAYLNDRIDEVRERNATRAAAKGMKGTDPQLIRKLYHAIIEYSCQLEEDLMAADDFRKAEGSK